MTDPVKATTALQRSAIAATEALWTGLDLVPISPHDENDLPAPARAIRCKPTGAAGTLRITTAAGNVRNTTIAAGEVLSVRVLRVHASGTTASGLEAIP